VCDHASEPRSERGEQRGFANLVHGTFSMFRNPSAPRIHCAMTKDKPKDLLSVVSLTHSDESIK
jgi:uncharacterized protein (TIGR02391 family)